MNKILLSIITLMLGLPMAATAQNTIVAVEDTTMTEQDTTFNAHFSTVSTRYSEKLSSLCNQYADWQYKGSDTLSNPYYFPLFAAPTLYTSPLRRAFSINPSEDKIYNSGISGTGVFASRNMVRKMEDALLHTYVNAPSLIRFEEDDLIAAGTGKGKEEQPDFKADVNLVKRTEDKISKVKPETNDDWTIVVKKPNFWTLKTRFGLKLMQNHYSDNWYQGGESNYSWLTELNVDLTYNNKQKIIFNNYLDAKLGFFSTNDDEKHDFRSNSDLLRLTNKLGVRATKHWYYTVMLQSWTQFYPGYRSNDDKVYSDFMSPFESVFSVGMEYKLNVKKFTLEAAISPFASNFKYVDRSDLATSFGVKEGKHSEFTFGSNVTMKYTWDIMKNVTWRGRIYYYTNYDRTQIEWENTFDLRINKYLTTKIFLYPRFDDNVSRAPGESYLQFKEELSFGLDINF